jgi:23S rRNA pseudouridine955/2504/2580 synthase
VDNQKNNTVQYVEVDPGFEGQRIDNFLLRELKSVPKSHVYKLLRSGQVRVNKGRVKAEYKLKLGDVVRIPPVRVAKEVRKEQVKPELLEFIASRVLFEDAEFVVINKPSGLPVHGGTGLSLGLIDIVKALYPHEKHIELAHRLDKGTSGCLIFAKKRTALRVIHAAFREDGVKKEYVALTKGHWAKSERHVNWPLLRYQLSSGERRVRVNQREGKASTTWFQSLQKFDAADLVQAKPVTGRTHQIRVHAQAMGHQIAGDDKYGDKEFNQAMHHLGLKRLFLHAKSIEFRLPSGALKRVEAPLDKELSALLTKLEALSLQSE